jgi:hypothetical protein
VRQTHALQITADRAGFSERDDHLRRAGAARAHRHIDAKHARQQHGPAQTLSPASGYDASIRCGTGFVCLLLWTHNLIVP